MIILYCCLKIVCIVCSCFEVVNMINMSCLNFENFSNNFIVIGLIEYIIGKDIVFVILYLFIVFFGIVGNGVVIVIV